MESAFHNVPWYRQFWPWFIMALPASAVIAGIATVIIATQNKDSLVADDYYKEGLAINQSIERDQVAANLEIRALVRFNANHQQVSLQLMSTKLKTYPDTLTLTLTHPTLDQLDQQITLSHQDEGNYSSATMQIPNGEWHLKLEPHDRHWRLTGRMDLAQGAQRLLSADN